ncbi:glutathione S-transferase family protein [Falsiroseomonas oryzae]|uniref:glutathione S-transferase family protein n=1 Tax=Falsiroseomonas oryzae TaxID=2766473 RepID=UPI0022EAF82B|nr:glutathione S-transferase family protein [Roseomonas sp. MO-31]
MPLTLHYLSGSPYTWRVQLALEHKGLAYALRPMSYDAGDFKRPDFAALNPRRRVPVLQDDDGFALYESAAILEYLEDIAPHPPLFAAQPRPRAIQRRLVREADEYFATKLEHLVQDVLFTPPERRDPARVAGHWAAMQAELALWETLIQGEFLAGELSAADLTLYPEIALGRRIAQRNPGLVAGELLGPKLQAWAARMEALPILRRTWPPHWGPPPGA